AEHRLIVERAREIGDAGDAKYEAEVSDAVDEEGLQIRENRGWTRVPEADEQIRDEADRFPAEEQLHEVVRHHEHQHREREQRNIGEESLITRIVVHVADRIDVHAQRYE